MAEFSRLPWGSDGLIVEDADGVTVADCDFCDVEAATAIGNAALIAHCVNNLGQLAKAAQDYADEQTLAMLPEIIPLGSKLHRLIEALALAGALP